VADSNTRSHSIGSMLYDRAGRAGETMVVSATLEPRALHLVLTHAAQRPAHAPLVGAALAGAAARLSYAALPAYMAVAHLPLACRWFGEGGRLDALVALRGLAAPDAAACAGGAAGYLAVAAADLVPALLMDARGTELRDMARSLGARGVGVRGPGP